MRYPFIGYWIESILEEDTNEINETETAEFFNGEVPFYYDYDSRSQKIATQDFISGITTVKFLKTIKTKAELPFKPSDKIKLFDGTVYAITEVTEEVDEKYKRIVSMNPNLKDRYLIKGIVLR